MRYKIGDLVQIKTWDRMLSQYGGMRFSKFEGRLVDYVSTRPRFTSEMEYTIQKLNCNRVLTIKESKLSRMNNKDVGCYFMKEMGALFIDDMIECYVEKYSRFELLDL